MSAIARNRPQLSMGWLVTVMAVPLLSGVIIIVALASNKQFTSLDVNFKAIVLIVASFGAIFVMLVGLSIWSWVHRRWFGLIFMVIAIATFALLYAPLNQLVYRGVEFMGW